MALWRIHVKTVYTNMQMSEIGKDYAEKYGNIYMFHKLSNYKSLDATTDAS